MVEQRAGFEQTVLVVDDESAVRKLVNASLTVLGVHLLEATNPEEALELYQALVEEKKSKLDLVITDIRMPNPRQGIEMVWEMVESGYKGPVMMMSGTMEDLQRADIAAFSARGITIVPFQKPFSPLIFIKEATKLLTRSQKTL